MLIFPSSSSKVANGPNDAAPGTLNAETTFGKDGLEMDFDIGLGARGVALEVSKLVLVVEKDRECKDRCGPVTL